MFSLLGFWVGWELAFVSLWALGRTALLYDFWFHYGSKITDLSKFSALWPPKDDSFMASRIDLPSAFSTICILAGRQIRISGNHLY
jgi:hypothetical protein